MAGKPLTAKWGLGADGPYLSVDELCEWIAGEEERLTKAGGDALVPLKELRTILLDWSRKCTKTRLARVAAAAPAAIQDLVDLRDELTEGP